mmetsp:Transcript_3208/g.7033  ORF Transcript_3208/g.7033 Transcript_3208/m.7033 type:complete len:83 (+) Transcript_3208:447-695(+)
MKYNSYTKCQLQVTQGETNTSNKKWSWNLRPMYFQFITKKDLLHLSQNTKRWYKNSETTGNTKQTPDERAKWSRTISDFLFV